MGARIESSECLANRVFAAQIGLCSDALMRAALRSLCLPWVVTAGVALAGTPPVPPDSSRTAIATGSGPANAPPEALSSQDLLLACPTTRDHVGRVVANAMVDGKGPFRFIIDTGANHSTASPRLATSLGLAPSIRDSMRVAGITGTAIVPSIPIRDLRAGDLTITHAQFPIIWSAIMTGADGILGVAGLTDDSLLVDFRHNRVVISRAESAAIPAGFTRIHASRLHDGLLSVPGQVGDVWVTAIIDTGSPQTLGNMPLYRALNSAPPGGAKAPAANVYGATRQVRPGQVQVAPTVDLGAIRIGNAVLVFGDFPIFTVWGLSQRPAIILGMDVLGTVNAFSIDFRHAEIGIDPRSVGATGCSIGYRVRQAGC